MEKIFLHLVNMSITAGWITLAVVILRLFLKKAPKWITVLLWGLVGLRLILPVSIESSLSLIPDFSPINTEIISQSTLPYTDDTEFAGVENNNASNTPSNESTENIQSKPNTENSNANSTLPITNTATDTKDFSLLSVFSYMWISGIGCMLAYSAVSYMKIRRRVSASLLIEDNTYICDDINTPFILGFIKPKIYTPSNLSDTEKEYVLNHEKAHIKRKDHLIKPIGFLLLSVYWFNPLLWVAYILLCRDIELACDEKVIKNMGIQNKKEYSMALLNCSIPRHMISACPLAFGEVGVKQRIRNILSYKKPAFWISIAAIPLCVVLAVGFLTNPVKKNNFSISVSDTGSDIDGISLEYVTSNFAEDNSSMPYLEITWHNNTDTAYKIKEHFTIFKKIDGKWVDTRIGYHEYLFLHQGIAPGESYTKQYNLWYYNIDESGEYRFESYFYQSYGDIYCTERTAWMEFEIKNPPVTDKSIFTTTIQKTSSTPNGIDGCVEYIHQKLKEDKNSLDEKSVITIGWHNQTGMTLATSNEFFTLYNEDTKTYLKSKAETSSDTSAITLPADTITRIDYSLFGIDCLEPGNYTLSADFSNDETDLSVKSHTAQISFCVEGQSQKEPVSTEGYVAYYCNSSPEIVKPQILLNPYSHLFRFTPSQQRGIEYTGKYYVEDDILTLQTDAASSVSFNFRITDTKQLRFIESESYGLPSGQYSAAFVLTPPFEDDAVFESETNDLPKDFLSEEATVLFSEAVEYISKVDFTSRRTTLNFSSSGYGKTFQLSNKYNKAAEKLYNSLKDAPLHFTHETVTKSSYYISHSDSYLGIRIYENDLIMIDSPKSTNIATYYCEGITEKVQTLFNETEAELGPLYTIEPTEDYQIHCVIKALDGTTLYDGVQSRSPYIEMVDKNLLFKWEQNGTGTLTRSGVFYNLETKEISTEPYVGRFDYYEGIVSCTGSGQVILRKLSDPSKVQIINDFKKPISSFVENIQNAYFTDDGKQIVVTYYSGEYQNGEKIITVTEHFDVEL